MHENDIQRALRDFIVSDILREPDRTLDATTPLMDSGIIESLSLIALIGFVQSHFDVRVPDSDILPRNFKDLNALTALVQRLQKEAAA